MSLEQTADLAAPAERLDGHRRLAPLVSAVARERAAERQAYMSEGCHSSARTHVFFKAAISRARTRVVLGYLLRG